ncbi:hypothetical protein J6590_068286, partial [Homalodisca vitripennis]
MEFTQGGVNTPPPPLYLTALIRLSRYRSLLRTVQLNRNLRRSIFLSSTAQEGPPSGGVLGWGVGPAPSCICLSAVWICKQNCKNEIRSTQLINRYKKVLVPLPTPTPRRRGPLLPGTAQKYASAQ